MQSISTHERDAAIADHLFRMERELDRTRGIVASLRDLLHPAVVPEVTHRMIDDMVAVSATERVGREEIGDWCAKTFANLYQSLFGDGDEPAGPGGAFYGEEFFTEAAGEVTAYVPIRSKDSGHMVVPGGTYAIAVHAGPFVDFDRTYAALGSHVAAHDTASPGPIREIYLVSPPDTADEAAYRTEVCWPIQ
jgi:effector-binding domain-containing protein